ncbi:MAG: 2-phospho-L-lactate guanylyltransferase [Rhodovibrionaceae bacterium]
METNAVWVVVPIKSFSSAKSRLAPVFGRPQRQKLAKLMARRVLKATAACPQIAGIAVVTADPLAREIAAGFGAEVCGMAGDEGVNAAAAAGFGFVRQRAAGVLILPSDIPLVRPDDLSRLLSGPAGACSVTIVADTAGQGTNALLLPSHIDFEFRFGANSARNHADSARRAGLEVRFAEFPRMALDIDTPGDVESLRAFDCSRLDFPATARA